MASVRDVGAADEEVDSEGDAEDGDAEEGDDEADPLGDDDPLGEADGDSLPLLLSGVVSWASAAPEIPSPDRSNVDAMQATTKPRTSLAVRL